MNVCAVLGLAELQTLWESNYYEEQHSYLRRYIYKRLLTIRNARVAHVSPQGSFLYYTCIHKGALTLCDRVYYVCRLPISLPTSCVSTAQLIGEQNVNHLSYGIAANICQAEFLDMYFCVIVVHSGFNLDTKGMSTSLPLLHNVDSIIDVRKQNPVKPNTIRKLPS